MAKAYEYEALGFSGEDVDSISVAIDESNNLTVTANLKDGTAKSSEPVALPTGGSGGGTQLYLHTVTFNITDYNFLLYLLTTNSAQYTAQTLLEDISLKKAFIGNSFITDANTNYYIIAEFAGNYDNSSFNAFYLNGTELSYVDFTLINIFGFTDTVTPL